MFKRRRRYDVGYKELPVIRGGSLSCWWSVVEVEHWVRPRVCGNSQAPNTLSRFCLPSNINLLSSLPKIPFNTSNEILRAQIFVRTVQFPHDRVVSRSSETLSPETWLTNIAQNLTSWELDHCRRKKTNGKLRLYSIELCQGMWLSTHFRP
jgi:hypothetical protein